MARKALHWWSPEQKTWLSWDEERPAWKGWDAAGATATTGGWTPWDAVLDDSHAPHYSWFVGAHTNAAFNEVDRHVLGGHGAEPAFVSVDSAAFGAALRGEATLAALATTLTRRQLLVQSVLAAHALRGAGVKAGDRVVLLMPHSLEAAVWIAAAKRLGAVYCCLAESTSQKALADRIVDLSTSYVLTLSAEAAGAHAPPAAAVAASPMAPPAAPAAAPALHATAAAAIGGYVPLETALRALRAALPDAPELAPAGEVDCPSLLEQLDVESICAALRDSFAGELAVEVPSVAARLRMAFALTPDLRHLAASLAERMRAAIVALHAEEAPALLVLTRPLQLGAAANGAGAATAGGGVEYTLTRWQTPSLSAGSPMRMVRSGGDLATLGDAAAGASPGRSVSSLMKAAEAAVVAAAAASRRSATSARSLTPSS